jgi:hypothetical protein
MPFLMARDTHVKTVTIANGAALSDAIDMRRYSFLVVHMPAAWTAASIGFQVSDSLGGTYDPLYDDDGNLLEITSPAVDKAYTAPAAVAAAHFLKIWSETSGSGVNQGAERSLILEVKS